MGETIHVSGCEHEAAAQLQRVFAEAMLSMSGLFGTRPGREVVAAEEVQQRRLAQPGDAVRLALFVDQ